MDLVALLHAWFIHKVSTLDQCKTLFPFLRYGVRQAFFHADIAADILYVDEK